MGGNHGLGSSVECQRLHIIKSPKVSLCFLFADPGISPKMTALGSQPVCRLSQPLLCARCWFIFSSSFPCNAGVPGQLVSTSLPVRS